MESSLANARWLNEDESAAWIAFIRLLHHVPALLDAQLRQDANLNHFEYGVLAILSAAPNRSLTMTEIADVSRGSLSRLSHVMKRLEGRGLVSRCPLAKDGRITTATMTDAGRATLIAAAPGHVAEARRLVVDALTPEQLTSLREIATVILDRINPTLASVPA